MTAADVYERDLSCHVQPIADTPQCEMDPVARTAFKLAMRRPRRR